jgi:PIN domain nuclease of toxin-antitoxin system
LADFHGDPADRLIVATAIVLGVPLITADAKIIEWSRRNRALQVIEM